MKKYYVHLYASPEYENPEIREVEYEHFEHQTEGTVVGYDGDVNPMNVGYRSERKQIRYSLFFDNELYDNKEDAEKYLRKNLEELFEKHTFEYEEILTRLNNIKNALAKLDKNEENHNYRRT